MILTENPDGPFMDGLATWHCTACDVNSETLHTTAEAVAISAMRHNAMAHGGQHKLRSIDDRNVSTLPDLDALSAKLWREGWELDSIADLFGTTERAVHTRLLRQGLVEPVRVASLGKPEHVRKLEKITAGIEAGLTVKEIVASTGIKLTTCYAIMSKHGLKVQRGAA